MLSRFPILECHSYHPWPLSTTLLEATIELAANQSVRLFGVHLAAQPFVLYELWHWWEIITLLRRIQPRSAKACLIAGDFNAIVPRDAMNSTVWPRQLKCRQTWHGGRVFRRALAEVSFAGFIDCFRRLHPTDAGFTLPTQVPNGRLDYIFVTKALKYQIQRCFVLRELPVVELAFDHYPVMAEFDFWEHV